MAEKRRAFPWLVTAGICAVAFLSTAGAADIASRDAAFAKARAALARGDGVAAEIALRDAEAQGADRASLAAAMGEALLAEGKLDKAREWLGPAQFAEQDRSQGFRMLSRLESQAGNVPAAEAALAKAIEADSNNADAWVDLAQLRYRGGNQFPAFDALQTALKVAPGNLRAIDFTGLIVRDQFGPEAALQWFERGLMLAPKDGVLLADYAATLGDMGRYKQMLVVTRRMLELGVSEPRAHYLQAVLAARAGNFSLARACLNRAGEPVKDLPSAMLLSGVIDLQGGNPKLAEETFRRLVSIQPQNEVAQMLLARAIYDQGGQKEVVEQYSSWAASESAPAYMLELVARSYEDLGQRELAAPLLDRAAAVQTAYLRPAFDFGSSSGAPADSAAAEVRTALSGGRTVDAVAGAERLKAAWPGMGSAHLLAGDAQFAAGRFDLAAQDYAQAGRVRFDDNLAARLVLTAARQGQLAAGAEVAATYLASRPQSPAAARLAADYAASVGDWGRARSLLENLAKRSGSRDVRLLSDLSFAQLRGGDAQSAAVTARRALSLQPASPVAAQALAMALSAAKQDGALADALTARAARP